MTPADFVLRMLPQSLCCTPPLKAPDEALVCRAQRFSFKAWHIMLRASSIFKLHESRGLASMTESSHSTDRVEGGRGWRLEQKRSDSGKTRGKWKKWRQGGGQIRMTWVSRSRGPPKPFAKWHPSCQVRRFGLTNGAKDVQS